MGVRTFERQFEATPPSTDSLVRERESIRYLPVQQHIRLIWKAHLQSCRLLCPLSKTDRCPRALQRVLPTTMSPSRKRTAARSLVCSTSVCRHGSTRAATSKTTSPPPKRCSTPTAKNTKKS